MKNTILRSLMLGRKLICTKPVSNKSCLLRPFSGSCISLNKAVAPSGLIKKKGPMLEKQQMSVETDPEKLVKYVCGLDYRKENCEDIPIKDDSEYPDWLWEIRLEKAPPICDMDPNTMAYWKRTIAFNRRLRSQLRTLKKY